MTSKQKAKFTLNTRLTITIRRRMVSSVMCFACVIGEFWLFQNHTPLTKQTLSEMISLWYAPQFTLKKRKEKYSGIYLFIHLDDYRPLSFASDWLLQTTSQMHSSILVVFEDISTFLTSGLFIIIHLYTSRLPVQYAALVGPMCLILWVTFSKLLHILCYTTGGRNF